MEAKAKVVAVAPEASDEVRGLAAKGRIEWRARAYRPADVRGALAVFAATSDRKVNRAVSRDATREKALVNAADDPVACSFTMPAVARRGALTLAVSTGGLDPGGAGRLRDELARSAAFIDAATPSKRVNARAAPFALVPGGATRHARATPASTRVSPDASLEAVAVTRQARAASARNRVSRGAALEPARVNRGRA